jgi:hypothetical protein
MTKASFRCGHPRDWTNIQLQSGQKKCKLCNQRLARDGMERKRWREFLAKLYPERAAK